MIEILYLILGILLVLLIFLDIVFTTYSMEGGGKFTDFFLRKTWRSAIWICGYNGRKRLLNFIGMLMMISLIFIWGLGLWIGVFLIFAYDPESVLYPQTNLPTGLSEKFYYTGYLLSTMGLGDFKPANSTWGIISSFFSFFGLVFITLMVSYALPVLSKVIEKKQFSLFIHHLGRTPQELLLHFWNGKDFSDLSKYSMELQMQILLIGQSQKAYPILHYFHASKKMESLVITLCLIDEALSLLVKHVSPDQWEKKEVVPIQMALTQYLETMVETYQYEEYKGASMPQPNLAMLTQFGVHLVNEVSTDHNRKELWSHILKSKGWTWKEIYPDNQDQEVL